MAYLFFLTALQRSLHSGDGNRAVQAKCCIAIAVTLGPYWLVWQEVLDLEMP